MSMLAIQGFLLVLFSGFLCTCFCQETTTESPVLSIGSTENTQKGNGSFQSTLPAFYNSTSHSSSTLPSISSSNLFPTTSAVLSNTTKDSSFGQNSTKGFFLTTDNSTTTPQETPVTSFNASSGTIVPTVPANISQSTTIISNNTHGNGLENLTSTGTSSGITSANTTSFSTEVTTTPTTALVLNTTGIPSSSIVRIRFTVSNQTENVSSESFQRKVARGLAKTYNSLETRRKRDVSVKEGNYNVTVHNTAYVDGSNSEVEANYTVEKNGTTIAAEDSASLLSNADEDLLSNLQNENLTVDNITSLPTAIEVSVVPTEGITVPNTATVTITPTPNTSPSSTLSVPVPDTSTLNSTAMLNITSSVEVSSPSDTTTLQNTTSGVINSTSIPSTLSTGTNTTSSESGGGEDSTATVNSAFTSEANTTIPFTSVFTEATNSSNTTLTTMETTTSVNVTDTVAKSTTFVPGSTTLESLSTVDATALNTTFTTTETATTSALNATEMLNSTIPQPSTIPSTTVPLTSTDADTMTSITIESTTTGTRESTTTLSITEITSTVATEDRIVLMRFMFSGSENVSSTTFQSNIAAALAETYNNVSTARKKRSVSRTSGNFTVTVLNTENVTNNEVEANFTVKQNEIDLRGDKAVQLLEGKAQEILTNLQNQNISANEITLPPEAIRSPLVSTEGITVPSTNVTVLTSTPGTLSSSTSTTASVPDTGTVNSTLVVNTTSSAEVSSPSNTTTLQNSTYGVINSTYIPPTSTFSEITTEGTSINTTMESGSGEDATTVNSTFTPETDMSTPFTSVSTETTNSLNTTLTTMETTVSVNGTVANTTTFVPDGTTLRSVSTVDVTTLNTTLTTVESGTVATTIALSSAGTVNLTVDQTSTTAPTTDESTMISTTTESSVTELPTPTPTTIEGTTSSSVTELTSTVATVDENRIVQMRFTFTRSEDVSSTNFQSDIAAALAETYNNVTSAARKKRAVSQTRGNFTVTVLNAQNVTDNEVETNFTVKQNETDLSGEEAAQLLDEKSDVILTNLKRRNISANTITLPPEAIRSLNGTTTESTEASGSIQMTQTLPTFIYATDQIEDMNVVSINFTIPEGNMSISELAKIIAGALAETYYDISVNKSRKKRNVDATFNNYVVKVRNTNQNDRTVSADFAVEENTMLLSGSEASKMLNKTLLEKKFKQYTLQIENLNIEAEVANTTDLTSASSPVTLSSVESTTSETTSANPDSNLTTEITSTSPASGTVATAPSKTTTTLETTAALTNTTMTVTSDFSSSTTSSNGASAGSTIATVPSSSIPETSTSASPTTTSATTETTLETTTLETSSLTLTSTTSNITNIIVTAVTESSSSASESSPSTNSPSVSVPTNTTNMTATESTIEPTTQNTTNVTTAFTTAFVADPDRFAWYLVVIIILGGLCFVLLIIVIILCRRKLCGGKTIEKTSEVQKVVEEEKGGVYPNVTPVPTSHVRETTTIIREPATPDKLLAKQTEILHKEEPPEIIPTPRRKEPPRRRPHPEPSPRPVENIPMHPLVQPSAKMSREPLQDSGDTNGDVVAPRFRSTVHPLSFLPPIHSTIMSEAGDSLTDEAMTERRLQQRSEIERHKNKQRLRRARRPNDEDIQRGFDRVLDPSPPPMFQRPNKRFHKRRGRMTLEGKPTEDPEMRELMGRRVQSPGHYKSVPPEDDSPSTDSGVTSPETTRRKMASLLEDAFSLISPSGQKNLVGPAPPQLVQPVPSPNRMIERSPMHHPDGRTSTPHHRSLGPTVPPPLPSTSAENSQVLFTRTQPPVVFLPNGGQGRTATYTGATASGKPLYITPIKQTPVPGDPSSSSVWTPYHAPDAVSPAPPHPHMTNALAHGPGSSGLPNGGPFMNGSVGVPYNSWVQPVSATTLPGVMPTTQAYYPQSGSGTHVPPPPVGYGGQVASPPQTHSVSPQQSPLQGSPNSDQHSTASLVQSIREEMARLAGTSTPVQSINQPF